MKTARSVSYEIAPAVLGQVFLHAAMAGMRMAAPLLALKAGNGKGGVGVLVALFALTQVFLSIPAGRYADRRGVRQPLRLAAVAASSGLALAAIWPVYPVLCVAALSCGGAVGAATIALQRHVGRVARTPSELSRAFSMLSIAPAGANFLGPMTAGVLIDRAGFRTAFAILAVLPLIAWLFARRAREHVSCTAPTPQTNLRAWDLLELPHMRRLMFMNVLVTSSWDFHGFMVPVIGHERGASASAIGMIMGAFAVAAGAVRLGVPQLLRRTREWMLITVAAGAAGLVLIAYPFATAPVAMATLSALLGGALGSVQPTALTLLHHIAPAHRRGEAMAVRLILSNATAVVMPMMLGVAGGLLGASGVFWLMGALVAAGSRLGAGLRGVGGA